MKTVDMKEIKRLRRVIERLSKDLGDLYISVDVMKCGLEMEHIEPQVIACMDSIRNNLGFIQQIADCSLEMGIQNRKKA